RTCDDLYALILVRHKPVPRNIPKPPCLSQRVRSKSGPVHLPTAQIIQFPGCEKLVKARQKRGKCGPDFHEIGFNIMDLTLRLVSREINGAQILHAVQDLLETEEEKQRLMKGAAARAKLVGEW
ncbi:MAG: hypothetical protein AAGG65_17185, partial [Pseudomonadota bacterium]